MNGTPYSAPALPPPGGVPSRFVHPDGVGARAGQVPVRVDCTLLLALFTALLGQAIVSTRCRRSSTDRGDRCVERASVASAVRCARSRTGLTEQQVVDLLAESGHATDAVTLRRWESTGRIELDSAVRLADIYGTTLDNLAGRRSYKRHSPNVDLAVPRGDAG